MKKLIALILSLTLLFAFAAPVMASKTISIVVDGKVIQTDVAPEIKNGRTMVPIRVIAEALGCEVEWEQATQTVKIISIKKYITPSASCYHLDKNCGGINSFEVKDTGTLPPCKKCAIN